MWYGSQTVSQHYDPDGQHVTNDSHNKDNDQDGGNADLDVLGNDITLKLPMIDDWSSDGVCMANILYTCLVSIAYSRQHCTGQSHLPNHHEEETPDISLNPALESQKVKTTVTCVSHTNNGC